MANFKLNFLLLIYCINNVLCKLSIRQEDWTYTTKAFTFNGEECVSDCEYSQCVVNENGDMKACYTTDEVPLIFYTSRFYDTDSNVCKSNCGFFGSEHQWCITENDVLDFCNSSPVSPTQISARNFTCKGPCTDTNPGSLNQYICVIEKRHDFCAPPAAIRQKPGTDDLITTVTEKAQNCSQVTEKPVTQTCQISTEQPNQNQCNCDCKTKEYNKKDIYFKIEANIPHEMVEKVDGNHYHFTINFDNKTPETEKGSSDRSTEKPASSGREDNNEHTGKEELPSTKPVENVSLRPSNNSQGKEESDEISPDMMRSNFGKE